MRRDELHFEDNTSHVRQQCVKLARDYQKAMSGTYVGRRWRAFKWRYDNNPAFKDFVDLLWISAVLGILCGSLFGITIVKYFNPHL